MLNKMLIVFFKINASFLLFNKPNKMCYYFKIIAIIINYIFIIKLKKN